MKPSSRSVILVIAVLASGCASQSTPAPTAGNSSPPELVVTAPPVPTATRPSASPSPLAEAPTRRPADLGCDDIIASGHGPHASPTLPPVPRPSINGADARAAAVVAGAADRLAGLSSYRFSVDVVGTSVASLEPSSVDLSMRGTLNRSDGLAVDALAGFRMRETNGTDAAISGGAQIKIGHGYLWATDNVSGVLEPTPVDAMANLTTLSAEVVAARVVVPFGAGYRRVGTEPHGGIMTAHYRATPTGIAAYAAAFQATGRLTADLWIASDGGYLSAFHIAGPDLLVQFEITHPEDPANVVVLPVAPLPDPIRPSGPPVDLQLEYQVMATNGVDPTNEELEQAAYGLRVRLDVATRPVRVEVERRYRILVTVCHTTTPEDDRRRLLTVGALTVVPLPRAAYGSRTAPGPMPLPNVGEPIDPALQPLSPATRLGITRAHVDPATGRRGVAFRLANEPQSVYGAYASGHLGEYVAIVLDGLVLAVLPIEGPTADGAFAFTGDYSEAETRHLSEILQVDPMRASLREIGHVEIPSTGS